MQVLIVDSDPTRQVDIAIAFMHAGYQVMPTASLRVAEACIRRDTVDLLIMTERVDGKLTHSLALMAEYRSPMVSTMLLTSRTDPDVDELFLLLPSLHCMLPLDAPTKLITKLALASLASSAGTCEIAHAKAVRSAITTPGVGAGSGAVAKSRASAKAAAKGPLILGPGMRTAAVARSSPPVTAQFVSAR